jgi:hypothetical protein
MPVLIGALLAILVIAVVLYPFLGRRLRPRPTADSRDRSGGGGPESIYEEIKTLQLEYDLGAVEALSRSTRRSRPCSWSTIWERWRP